MRGKPNNYRAENARYALPTQQSPTQQSAARSAEHAGFIGARWRVHRRPGDKTHGKRRNFPEALSHLTMTALDRDATNRG